jgi:hypothetical protein
MAKIVRIHKDKRPTSFKLVVHEEMQKGKQNSLTKNGMYI